VEISNYRTNKIAIKFKAFEDCSGPMSDLATRRFFERFA